MYKYILKRLALMIPVIIGVSFIIFSIMSFMPGNPARLILGEKATPEAIEQINDCLLYTSPSPRDYAALILALLTQRSNRSLMRSRHAFPLR